MCTCIKWKWNNSNFFGRTLDSINEYNMDVVITPRNYAFTFRNCNNVDKGYSIIGMATIIDDYPLYAEAINEYGLSMAGLEFPDNACYYQVNKDKNNVASFELIPFILRQCRNISETRLLLNNINITNQYFSDSLPSTSLHWMVSDNNESIVIESTIEGLKVYTNHFNVLTNNPQFNYHKENVNNYLNLTNAYPSNRLSNDVNLKPYSNGVGSYSLPGDYSSSSRFIKALFLSRNFSDINSYNEAVMHYFHVLDAISPTKGSVLTKENKCHYTIYSSCIDCDNLIYYFKKYENNNVYAVKMKEYDMNSERLKSLTAYREDNIKYLN